MTRYVHRCRSVSFRSGLHRNIPFRVMQVTFCFRWRANMVSKKVLIKTGKILLPVIIAAGKPVFDAARRKFSSKTATKGLPPRSLLTAGSVQPYIYHVTIIQRSVGNT